MLCFATKGTLVFLVKGLGAECLAESNSVLPNSAPEIDAQIAVPVDLFEHVPVDANAAVVPEPDLHRESHFLRLGAVS